MALKTNFEDANFISSPFVDEVANPGDLNAQGLAQDREKLRQAANPIGPAAIKHNTMLRKRIKERKIAQRLRDKAKLNASHPIHG